MIKIKKLLTQHQNHIYRNTPVKKYDEPKIFRSAIYRLPTKMELQQFAYYPQLNSKQIYKGLVYTTVGKGIKSRDNMEIIKHIIKMLIQRYPQDPKYKQVYKIYLKDEKLWQNRK